MSCVGLDRRSVGATDKSNRGVARYMEIRRWIWCLQCERCFEVHLSREPEAAGKDFPEEWESPFGFGAELAMQLGVERHGEVIVKCAYDDCDGGLSHFWWWERFRLDQPELPAAPEVGKPFPSYRKMG